MPVRSALAALKM